MTVMVTTIAVVIQFAAVDVVVAVSATGNSAGLTLGRVFGSVSKLRVWCRPCALPTASPHKMAYFNPRCTRPSSVPTGRNSSSSSRSVGSRSQSRGVASALSRGTNSPSWSAPRAQGSTSAHEQERNSKKRPRVPPWMQQASLLRPKCKVKRPPTDVSPRMHDASVRKEHVGGTLGHNSKGVGDREACQLCKIVVEPDKRTPRAAFCEVSDCVFATSLLCEECVVYGYRYKRQGAVYTWPIQACKSCRIENLFTQDSRLSRHMATVFLESHIRASSAEPWLMDVIYPEVTKPLVSTSANAIGLRCFMCSADTARPLKGQFHVCTNARCPTKYREMCQTCTFL